MSRRLVSVGVRGCVIVWSPLYERCQPIAGHVPVNGEPFPSPPLGPDGGRGNLPCTIRFYALPQNPVTNVRGTVVTFQLFLVRVSLVLHDFAGLRVTVMLHRIHSREIRRTRQSNPVLSEESLVTVLTVHRKVLTTTA